MFSNVFKHLLVKRLTTFPNVWCKTLENISQSDLCQTVGAKHLSILKFLTRISYTKTFLVYYMLICLVGNRFKSSFVPSTKFNTFEHIITSVDFIKAKFNLVSLCRPPSPCMFGFLYGLTHKHHPDHWKF